MLQVVNISGLPEKERAVFFLNLYHVMVRILSYPTLSCLVSPYLTLPYFTLPYPILSQVALSCLVQLHLSLPCCATLQWCDLQFLFYFHIFTSHIYHYTPPFVYYTMLCHVMLCSAGNSRLSSDRAASFLVVMAVLLQQHSIPPL